MLALASGCADETGSADPAPATCERRDECGNLDGVSIEACVDAERALLGRIDDASARTVCADAKAGCLNGATCDDFRACQANLDRTTCPCPTPTVTLLDPVDGQALGPADDADPNDTQLQYDFVVEAVCLDDDESVELVLLEPVMSSYGFASPDSTGRAVIRAPLLPGSNRFVARGSRTLATSAEISVEVTP